VEERPGSGPEPVHVWVKPVDGDQRSAAHALLLALAATLVGAEPVLRHDEAGRPHVDGLWVSVSHGHDLVAVAASAAGPVGVDVENRRSFEVASLAKRWFDPAELAWMAAQPDEVEAFLRLWTAKEAVGKALGRGLRGSGLRRLMPLPPAPLAPPGPLPPPEPLPPREPLDSPPPDTGPLTGDSLTGSTLTGDLVPSEPTLALLHLSLRANAVLAVAVPAGVRSVEVCEHHGAALRSTVTSRTSFPVVVRGN
jgi:4'-phosphopantetheinyl transferase